MRAFSASLTSEDRVGWDAKVDKLVGLPVPELSKLRTSLLVHETARRLSPNELWTLPIHGDDGATAELMLSVPVLAAATSVGLAALAPPATKDGALQLLLNISAPLANGSRAASLSAINHFAPPYRNSTTATVAPFLVLPDEETVDLHVFVDRVVVEAFALGGRGAVIANEFRPDPQTTLHLFAAQDVAVNVSVFNMSCGYTSAPLKADDDHAAPTLPTLTYEQLRLTFDPTSGGIIRVQSNESDTTPYYVNDEAVSLTEGRASAPGKPLWRLLFDDGGIVDSSQCPPTFEDNVITWRGCEYAGAKLDVIVTWSPANLPPHSLSLGAAPPAKPFGAHGRIRVIANDTLQQNEDRQSPVLSTVVFPILRLRRVEPASQVTLVWSRESGRSWQDPWADDAPLGYGVGTQVGTPGPTQMGCMVDEKERGLYWATYDPAASQKHFYYVNNKTEHGTKSNGIVEAAIGHVYPEPLDGGPIDYSPDYPVVISTFAGDFWDAAQIYRAWALQQSWVPSVDAPGADSWLKRTHVWVRGDTKHRDEVASQRQTLLKYAELFGTPLGVQLYDWSNGSVYQAADGSSSSSFTFPSRWPPQDGWDWADLKAKGVHVLPYVNSEADNTGDANFASDHGNASAIREHGGTLGVGDDGSVAMCASQAAWHRRLLNASVRLVRAGAAGIYMCATLPRLPRLPRHRCLAVVSLC